MLAIFSASTRSYHVVTDLANPALPDDTIWFDLENPTPTEAAFVERATGFEVQSRDALSEIEASSRLADEDGVLYLSATGLWGVQTGKPETTPLGFIMSARHLVTVRFAPLPAFETFISHACAANHPHPTPAGLFAGLLDTIVDRAADTLEKLGQELDVVSNRVFHAAPANSGRVIKAAPEEANLRETLRKVGRIGDTTSKIREVLLGFARIVPYVEAHGESWIPREVIPHLVSLRRDIASLNDHDAYLTNKTQFLLDATLGLINIQQNNIIKVLTVVSIVGVPPTFIASLYGMNFKSIPELDWSWGYPYALALMVVTAIGPYLWFKYRGWL